MQYVPEDKTFSVPYLLLKQILWSSITVSFAFRILLMTISFTLNSQLIVFFLRKRWTRLGTGCTPDFSLVFYFSKLVIPELPVRTRYRVCYIKIYYLPSFNVSYENPKNFSEKKILDLLTNLSILYKDTVLAKIEVKYFYIIRDA